MEMIREFVVLLTEKPEAAGTSSLTAEVAESQVQLQRGLEAAFGPFS
jgi:hypothetical protein